MDNTPKRWVGGTGLWWVNGECVEGIVSIDSNVKQLSNKGIRGSPLHKDIVDWTRFTLTPYIRTVFPNEDWSVIYADALIMQELGYEYTFPRSGGYYLPDGLWVYGSGYICLEVGKCDINKVPLDTPILHIGFDGQVNAVNIVDSTALEVRDAAKEFWLGEWQPL